MIKVSVTTGSTRISVRYDTNTYCNTGTSTDALTDDEITQAGLLQRESTAFPFFRDFVHPMLRRVHSIW